MITVYKIDHNGVYTGDSIEIGAKDPISPEYVVVAPPTTEGFHIWDGSKWFTRQTYPTPPPRPAPPTPAMTHLQFIRRFTHAEAATFETLLADARNGTSPLPAEVRGQVLLMGRLFDAAQDVKLDDPDTVSFVQALIGLDVLTAERASEVLDPNWRREEDLPGLPVED